MAKKQKITLSYSKMKIYECPKKYHYQYVQRLYRESNARNTLPGRAIQKLFEEFSNSDQFQNGSKWLYDNVVRVFSDEYLRFKDDTRFHVRESYDDVLFEVVDMIPACYDVFVKKKWNTGRVRSELFLTANIAPSTDLVGAIDFLVQTPSETTIIDFKATAKGIKTLDKKQLIIYNILHNKNFGYYPQHTYFFLTRDNQLVKTKITQADIDNTTKELIETADRIRNKNFEKNPSKENCTYCPFKRECWGSAKKSPW